MNEQELNEMLIEKINSIKLELPEHFKMVISEDKQEPGEKFVISWLDMRNLFASLLPYASSKESRAVIGDIVRILSAMGMRNYKINSAQFLGRLRNNIFRYR